MLQKLFDVETKFGPQEGTLQAAFSTFDITDRDGDIVRASAFKDGQEAPMVWAHDWAKPVGKGVIRVEQKRAIFDGSFFLNTAAGRDAYETVKAMGPLQQYSWGFSITKTQPNDKIRGLDITGAEIHEVSPVLVGANPQTATLAVKSVGELLHDLPAESLMAVLRELGVVFEKGAIAPMKTATSDASWDGPANEARLASAATGLRKAFAWIDPEADPETKAAYKFIHHFVGEDGSVGAASLVACSAGIAVLNGGRTGTTIPEADKAGVWRHLAAHLSDAGAEPPPLKDWRVLARLDLEAAELGVA